MDKIKKLYTSLVSQHGIKHWSFAAKKNNEFMELLSENNTFPDLPFSEKVYCLIHDYNPFCANGKKRKFISHPKGYRFCGRANICPCAAQSVSNKCKNIDHKSRLAKTHKTIKERYGLPYPPQIVDGRKSYLASDKAKCDFDKSRKTMVEKYGYDNPWKNTDHDRKAIAQRNFSEETKEIINSKELYTNFVEGKSIPTIANELQINATTVFNYLKKYDIPIELSSSFEDEIYSFLKTLNINIRTRDRTVISPKELDFYLPDYKLGIEFNGLYWHSCQVIDDNTHRDKWLRCNEAGVRLLMINEDEWVRNPDIWKKKILNLLGMSEKGIGARKLTIQDIPTKDAYSFCERHHIQGPPQGTVRAVGAFHGNTLVGCLTYARQRKTGSLDLSRYCSDGKVYAGMFSKLLKHSNINEPLVTFADLRYSDGKLYQNNGFILDGEIRPDYKYVKRNKTYHKSAFSKRLIKKKYGIDWGTERDMMRYLNYSRIYDCGKIRYKWCPKGE